MTIAGTDTPLAAPPPQFPREALAGTYALCSACGDAVYPNAASEAEHWRRHQGVQITPDRRTAAEADASRYTREHAAALQAADARRRCTRASRPATTARRSGDRA